MSKYINGLKGNQESPHYKTKAERLKEKRLKLAEAIASGNKQLAKAYRLYIDYHTQKQTSNE
mgnify:CR=1 FL=1